jgi:hypothetical protein
VIDRASSLRSEAVLFHLAILFPPSAEPSQHAQEEDDVGCCPKENSSSATGAVGESEGGSE